MHAIQHPVRRRQQGQGMVEYIIIVALIAIAAIAAFTFFGSTMRSQLGGAAKELAGQSSEGARGEAATKAQAVQDEGRENKGMSKYQADNAR